MVEFFQKHYPDDVAHCYGCGQLNQHGLRIESRWEGEEGVCRFTPSPFHTAFPGFVYGGLIASIIDCHSMGTAAAAWMRTRGIEIGDGPTQRFVTGRLEIDYLRPSPLGPVIELRARATEIKEKKVIVECDLVIEGNITARGRAIAVRMPDGLIERSRAT